MIPAGAATGAATLGHFVTQRWLRPPAGLERRHNERLSRFLTSTVSGAPRYAGLAGRPLSAFPIVDKSDVLGDFAAFNVAEVSLDEAMSVARAAERSRDFSPTVRGLTVGLSSGTSGRPGVFLVDETERRRWAGALLAQTLSGETMRRLVRRPLRISLLLRANSNLYESVGSRRVRFTFHDLARPLEQHADTVAEADVVFGPPSVLAALTDLIGSVEAAQVISVAETLEPDDAKRIEAAWGVRPEQIYQATEGFLGASCLTGRVHLNEEMIHIERHWLDDEHFMPIITDMSRTTQMIVRYRLDDVLLAAREPCPCGRATASVEAVLGRADDVLSLERDDGPPVPVFPDLLRHCLAMVGPKDYRVRQHGHLWQIALQGARITAVEREIAVMAGRLGARAPRIVPTPWPAEDPLAKRRRIVRVDGPALPGAMATPLADAG